jgi:hypothetical protein
MRLAVTLLTLLMLAAPARAAGPELAIADDRILLWGGEPADRAVREWSALGIESVRIFALWSRIETEPGVYDWGQLDVAVHRVAAAGMKPFLTITGPGPLWSSKRAERGDPRYDPDPKRYAAFARAVAERYGDRVDRYVLWNEPNLGTWLRPQNECRRRTCTQASAHRYRALVRAAYPAVHAADPGAEVLIGALSSRGSDARRENSTSRPLAFLRALGCVDERFKRVRSGECRGFKPAPADGFAIHPHGVLTAPDKPFSHPDDLNLASLGKLTRALDKIRARGGLTKRLNVFIDEFGYQTNPPDRISGVSPTKQNAWLQRAAYQAWANPRVKLLTQYLWQDEPLAGAFAGWQSGLFYADGRAKPSLRGFRTPFVLDARRSRLWGQVRDRSTSEVVVQRRLRGSTRWRDVAVRRTDARGFWSWTTKLPRGAAYRFVTPTVRSAVVRR